MTLAAQAPPDGGTLMLAASAIAGAATRCSKRPFGRVRDLTDVSQAAISPRGLVVTPPPGAKSMTALIASARLRPGGPGFASSGIGIVAPAKAPRAIVDRLSKAVGRILLLPHVRDRIAAQSICVPAPGVFVARVRPGIVIRGKVFKAAGVKVD